MTAGVANRIAAPSPRSTARRAGLLYLISGVPAAFSVLVFFQLFVRGDAAATATRILAAEGLFRLGFAADLVGILFYVAAVHYLYEVFKPVGRLARLMLVFNLIGAGIQVIDSVHDLTALLLLKGGPTMAALAADQARSLAHVFLRLHMLTYDVAFLFFGAGSVVMGALILRSTFLPRILGVLMAIDGMGYLTFGFATFLSPPLAARLYPYLPFLTAFLGELPTMLWLIVRTVNEDRWTAQAAARAA